MKYLILAIVLLLGGSAGTWAYLYNRGADESKETLITSTCVAQRGPLRINLVEAGTIKAKNAEEITSQLRRGGTITWLVAEGTEVKKDEVLARIDDTDIKRELDDLDSQLLEAKTYLKTAQNDLQIQLEDNAASLAQSELDLDSKKSDFDLFVQVTHPGKSQELQDRLTTSELDQRRIEERHDRAVKLKEDGFVTEAELKTEAIELRRATMALDQARTDLKAYAEFTAGKDRKTKEFALNEAERQLERAKVKADSLKAQKEALLTQRERQVKQLEDRIIKKKEELDQTVIKSPGNGIVIYGAPDRPWERGNIKVGGQLWQGTTLFTLPDLGEMQVSLNVHEADINKIKAGLPTVTTCETYPGMMLPGRIEKIATLANTGEPWSPKKVKEFSVTVTLDQANPGIKPGISAKTEILIEELADVLYVPVQSVFINEGHHFCFVEKRSEIEERRVDVGASTDLSVVVKSGLEAGEVVLLYRPEAYRAAPKIQSDPARPGAIAAESGKAEEVVTAAPASTATEAPAAVEGQDAMPVASEAIPVPPLSAAETDDKSPAEPAVIQEPKKDAGGS